MREFFSNSHYLALAATTLLGITARLTFVKGMAFEQSIQLAKNAWNLFSGESLGGDGGGILISFLRTLRRLPADERPISFFLGLLYKLFGVGELTSLILPFIASLALGLLIYLLARELLGKSASLLAVFFWAILPVEIFHASSLLPVLPIVAWNLLAVYLFLISQKKDSRGMSILAGAIVLIGLAIDWTYSLPTGFFLSFLFLRTKKSALLSHLAKLFWPLLFVLLVFPQIGNSAVDFYYRLTAIFENLLLLPLLIFSLLLAAQHVGDKQPKIILLWLAIQAASIAPLSQWILPLPLIEVIGVSGYWIQLLVPGILLIAWQFANTLKAEDLGIRIAAISFFAWLYLLAFFRFSPTAASPFLSISRISVGLAFFSIALYLTAWKKERLRQWLAYAIFVLMGLSMLLITFNYSESQSYVADDPQEIYAFLSAVDGHVELYLIEDSLFDRFYYLNGFELDRDIDKNTSLTLQRLNANFLDSLSAGDYILLSDNLEKFVLGTVPEDWILLLRVSNSAEQGLNLYLASTD